MPRPKSSLSEVQRALEQTAQQLRVAVRSRDEFLSVAAHELKTPLTTLSLQVEGLMRAARRDPQSLDPEWVCTKLETVQRQTARLTQLVNELLDVTRIQAGRLELHLEPVDLGAVVREVVERFHHEAEAAGCAISLEAPVGIVGRWDSSRLDQVVTNLVSNAVKYGKGHPVTVRVIVDRGAARVEVADGGIGIDPADQARIFEKFERLVVHERYRGMGLGLWITRQIVERMGGTVRVTSTPGRGSCFTVKLPRGRHDALTAAEPRGVRSNP